MKKTTAKKSPAAAWPAKKDIMHDCLKSCAMEFKWAFWAPWHRLSPLGRKRYRIAARRMIEEGLVNL